MIRHSSGTKLPSSADEGKNQSHKVGLMVRSRKLETTDRDLDRSLTVILKLPHLLQ
jgi:hypothetical protein